MNNNNDSMVQQPYKDQGLLANNQISCLHVRRERGEWQSILSIYLGIKCSQYDDPQAFGLFFTGNNKKSVVTQTHDDVWAWSNISAKNASWALLFSTRGPII